MQPGQKVVLQSNVLQYENTKLVIDALYEAGAGDVIMDWVDDHSYRQRLLNGNDESINNLPTYANATFNDYCKDGAASLRILGNDLNVSDGIDPQRLANYAASTEKSIDDFRLKQQMSQIPWVVCRFPNLSWAKKVFPNKPNEDALDYLWDAIFQSLRITGDGKSLSTDEIISITWIPTLRS